MKHYPPEFKADAVALYESRPEATIRSVAADLGVNPETLRNWVRAAGVSRPRGGRRRPPSRPRRWRRRTRPCAPSPSGTGPTRSSRPREDHSSRLPNRLARDDNAAETIPSMPPAEAPPSRPTRPGACGR
ncbi:transposase [Streptomyces spiralis]